MVVGPNLNAAPLFSYEYTTFDGKVPHSMFRVRLLENGVLEYTTFDSSRAYVNNIQLPAEKIVPRCQEIIQAQRWWLGNPNHPTELFETWPAKSYSYLGVRGFRMLICQDFESMSNGQVSLKTIYTRRMRFVFDAMSELLLEYGFLLVPEYFQQDHRQKAPSTHEEVPVDQFNQSQYYQQVP